MKYLNLTKQIACVALFALIFTACKKAVVSTPMGDAGQTLVKILDGGTPYGFGKISVPFINTPTTAKAVDIRRDIPSESELNKEMTVIVKDDTAAVSFFNRDTVSSNPNRTNPGKLFYVKLPPNWYTVGTGTPRTAPGGTYSVKFSSGEFAKGIYITIPDATLFDPSTTYALGFTILSADAGGKISTQKGMMVAIGAKNIVHEDLLWDFYRWNLAALQTSQPTIPISSGWTNAPATLTTIASNANEIPSGYFIQPRYRLTFTNVGGVATNFVLSFNPSDLAALNGGGVTVVDGPNLWLADFAAKHYKFQYQVYNGSAFRYLIDDYHP